MPLQYEGVVAEHNAVRSSAGVFDVSHLGKLRVSGTSAGEALDRALTADVANLPVGKATYALVLDDSGGCIDDVFVYRFPDDDWVVVPNASNVGAVAQAIEEAGAEPVDEWDRWAILALQGPESDRVFERTFDHADALGLVLHEHRPAPYEGIDGFVARTGYTGERGFELYVPAPAAEKTFKALVANGARPGGLGARDTLRLEMGYALYGHELSRDIDPLEAGLGWAIAWESDFRGKAALEEVRAAGRTRRTFGVRCSGRGVPRQGHPVAHGDRAIGEVTSGNFSPTLGTGIALAIGPGDDVPEEGAEVAIEARGRRIPGAIVKPPFVRRGRGAKT